MNSNAIYIIGSGAIGKALAAFLKLESKNVVILRGRIENKAHHVEKIKIELNDKKEVETNVEISTLSNFETLDGLIVVATKSFGNGELSKVLKSKAKNSPIVILQNGLGVEQAFIDNQFAEIYRCVLFATSQCITEYQLRFKPVSVSPIGIVKGNIDTLQTIVDALNNANFQFRAEAKIHPVIWKKAIINSVFNSVCPLLETDNGIFHRDERAQAVAQRVITECIAVARSAQIFLEANDVMSSLLQISKASDGQLISTFVDIKNKRKTEIETLNFAIVDEAKRLNLEQEVTETKLLGELTKLKSDLAASQTNR